MLRLRTLLAALLAGGMLLTACSPKQPTTPAPSGPQTQAPKRPELTAPIEGALTALRDMNAAGKNQDIPGANGHFITFRNHWATVKPELEKENDKLAIHIENGAEELDIEFKKPKETFRFYELDEETVKIGRLLSQAAEILGAPIRAELVQKDPTLDIPFNQEKRVEIIMVDHKFRPGTIEVEQHTKLTFVLINKGQMPHEFELGHYAVEQEDIQPGETRELTLVVLDAGEFEYACHIPGHYEVGMYGKLKVKPAELKKK